MRAHIIGVLTGAVLVAGCNTAHNSALAPASIQPVAYNSDATSYPAPTGFSVTVGAGVAWLRWQRPSGLLPLTRAYVYRNTQNDLDSATLLSGGFDNGLYTDFSISSGTQYWYWVRYGDGTNFGPAAMGSIGTRAPTTGPNPPVVDTAYEIAPVSLQADAAPLLVTPDLVQVGAMLTPSNLGPARIFHGDVAVWNTDRRDGVTAAMLQEYLTDDALAWNKIAIARFYDAPTVRIQKGATPEQIRETAHAVQLVNYWLPQTWKLALDLRPIEHTPGRPDNGTIVVEFADRATWALPGGSNTLGKARKWAAGVRVLSAEVWIDPDQSHGAKRMTVLVHELLHALGRDHVDASRYPGTLMTAIPNGLNGYVLHPLDRDVLTAVHGVLGNLTFSRDLTSVLASWSDAALHLVGEMPNGHGRFGVATRNGFTQAWAEGPRPLFPLGDNAELTGTASWNGRLLGYTPDGAGVAGDMDMAVDLSTMIGGLGFSTLEMWPVRMPVGAVGSGTTWSDGALNYAIRVSGNGFLRIGGDAGKITGAFFGDKHGGAGGTLYRDDLIAGFGGWRASLVEDEPTTPETKPTPEPVPAPELPPATLADTGGYSFSSSSSTRTINGVTTRVSQQTINIGQYGYWAKIGDSTLFRANLTATGSITNGTPRQSYTSSVTGTRTPFGAIGRSATWTGGVRGVTANFTRVTGQSRIEYDLAADTLDVTFSGFDNGQAGMTWNGLDIVSGAFRSGTSLEGAFYGTHHQGIAGKFNRNGLRGVFGALRE